jgi:ATP-dependent Clp protease ATP-binding subunit ClpC
MEAKFSQRVKDVLSYSREEALRLGNDYIGLEHILLGILREGEGLAVQMMKYFGMDLIEVRKMIEKAVANPGETLRQADNLPLVRQAERH